jgi:hypothetical protein
MNKYRRKNDIQKAWNYHKHDIQTLLDELISCGWEDTVFTHEVYVSDVNSGDNINLKGHNDSGCTYDFVFQCDDWIMVSEHTGKVHVVTSEEFYDLFDGQEVG